MASVLPSALTMMLLRTLIKCELATMWASEQKQSPAAQ
jgi:hypothetical protein